MTYEESLKALDELYQQYGRDYVVHAGNHPEILRAWSDKAVADLEAEKLSRLDNSALLS
jgi:hypothetical protein